MTQMNMNDRETFNMNDEHIGGLPMAEYIASAELTRYNANNRGTRTGDCVKRAISFAFDESYIKISQELNAQMKSQHSDSYKYSRVYDNIIKAHGGSDSMKPDRVDMTLNEFADANSQGTWLVTTGPKPTDQGQSNHIVCVVDGVVYDSWDSRNQYVYKYYSTPHQHKEVTNIRELRRTLAYEAHSWLLDEGQKLLQKSKYADWASDCLYEVDDETVFKDYNFTVEVQLKVHFATGLKTFTFPIVFVMTPTMTEEEGHKMVEKTAKVRLYDRFYAIHQKYEQSIDEQEGRDYAASAGLKLDGPSAWNGTEQKFYDSLPGWVKGRIRHIYVQYPGQYSDSYTLSIYPLPEWPVEKDYLDYNGGLRFESYNAWEIKDMLNRYKTKGEVEGRDYYYSEEY